VKRWELTLASAAAMALLLSPCPSPVHAGDDPASRSGWFCPWCGGQYQPFDSGSDRQETMRYYHHWMGFDGRRPREGLNKPLDRAGAAQIMEECLRRSGRNGLRITCVSDIGEYFEAQVTAPDGTPAGRLLVDKRTGMLRALQERA
jgi:hypothetical protein